MGSTKAQQEDLHYRGWGRGPSLPGSLEPQPSPQPGRNERTHQSGGSLCQRHLLSEAGQPAPWGLRQRDRDWAGATVRAGPGEVVPSAGWEILSEMAGSRKSGNTSRSIGSGICPKCQRKLSHAHKGKQRALWLRESLALPSTSQVSLAGTHPLSLLSLPEN